LSAWRGGLIALSARSNIGEKDEPAKHAGPAFILMEINRGRASQESLHRKYLQVKTGADYNPGGRWPTSFTFARTKERLL